MTCTCSCGMSAEAALPVHCHLWSIKKLSGSKFRYIQHRTLVLDCTPGLTSAPLST